MYVQGAAATPVELLRAMTDYGVRCDVRNVRLYHMHLEGAAPFAKPENASTLRCIIIISFVIQNISITTRHSCMFHTLFCASQLLAFTYN